MNKILNEYFELRARKEGKGISQKGDRVFHCYAGYKLRGSYKKHPVLSPLPFPQEIFQMFLERE